jgi:D-alanyl-D-alanine dipeptidase
MALCRAAHWQVWAAVALGATLTIGRTAAEGALPVGFVYLRDIDPTIAQEIRYATSDNFVGRPLAGYEAGECILRREVAAALKQVQADLADLSLALKVYDCYRPERAVAAMAQWASDGRPAGASKRFFPRLQKNALFALGYIASISRHSTGTAVDATLIDPARGPAAAFDPAVGYAPCTAPPSEREPDSSLDMGTGYDCLDVNGHTSSSAVGVEQRRRRTTLVAVMTRHGFRNYFREWWHFAYAGAAPVGYYDFPIRARRALARPD